MVSASQSCERERAKVKKKFDIVALYNKKRYAREENFNQNLSLFGRDTKRAGMILANIQPK